MGDFNFQNNATAINGGLWIIWAFYWLVKARGNKKTLASQNLRERVSHGAHLGLAFILLFSPAFSQTALARFFIHPSAAVLITGNVVTFLGLAFAIWARVYLGTNWSGTVTIKVDHEIVRTGPYAIVRNPIYTGYLTATCGSALVNGRYAGILAVVLVLATFLRKIHQEEKFLINHFGAAYEDYRRQTSALIPFII